MNLEKLIPQAPAGASDSSEEQMGIQITFTKLFQPAELRHYDIQIRQGISSFPVYGHVVNLYSYLTTLFHLRKRPHYPGGICKGSFISTVPSTLIRHENAAFGKNALSQTGGI